MLARGQYDQPGDPVTAGVPAALGKLPADLPRIAWVWPAGSSAPDNPLTARVAVNRYWQLVFGDGLVRTVNDFGLQGEPPSHPELLDWLAVDFMRSGWDVKRLLRLMVTQRHLPAVVEFHARTAGASTRRTDCWPAAHAIGLPAELIRDQALAIGGLLVEQLGGPSVKPYQPPGLWEAVSYNGDQTYEQDHGESLYRRSLYTFWKRQAPPPAHADVRRPDPRDLHGAPGTDQHAAAGAGAPERRHLRRGCPRPGDADDAIRRETSPVDRVRYGFRRATGRWPNDDEVAVLKRLLRAAAGRISRSGRNRPRRCCDMGESPVDTSLEPCELAAWTMTASHAAEPGRNNHPTLNDESHQPWTRSTKSAWV